MRRGFKTEANQIARDTRGELGLSHTAPLDVQAVAAHLDIPLLKLSALRSDAPHAVRFFSRGGESSFSGATVFCGSHRTIVFNDAHSPGRQASDIAHELAHGLLLHPPTPALDGRGCREWDRSIEEEADWLGGALLVPEEAALLIVQAKWSRALAAAEYGVTERMVQFRINVTGARKRVARMAR